MAKAMDTASRIIAICMEMVVPGLGGYWLDKKFDTEPWLALLGFGLGMLLATMQLIRMTSHAGGHKKSNPPKPPDVTSDQDQTP